MMARCTKSQADVSEIASISLIYARLSLLASSQFARYGINNYRSVITTPHYSPIGGARERALTLQVSSFRIPPWRSHVSATLMVARFNDRSLPIIIPPK